MTEATLEGARPEPRHQDEPTPPATPGPVKKKDRIVTLDVLRGVAILGILLVNIEHFRGSDIYHVMGGRYPEHTGADGVVEFLVGWLVFSKFMTAFALLFGMGAALMTRRAYEAGASPRGLLARRYAWLAVFGLLHMGLLFYGDILFLYAITGFLLLFFINLRPRTLLIWAGAIYGVLVFLTVLLTAIGLLAAAALGDQAEAGWPSQHSLTDQAEATSPSQDGETEQAEAGEAPAPVHFSEIFSSPDGWERFIIAHGKRVSETYREGSFGEQLRTRALEAAFFQTFALVALPWVLILFLCGLALGRSGFLSRLHEERATLRRVAWVALPLGLLLNIPLGFVGALGSGSLGADPEASTLLTLFATVASLIGVPTLTVGYLSSLALLCRRERFRAFMLPFQRTGRMALTAYLSQSLLCWFVFVGLGYYDAFSPAQSLLIVLAVWIVLLVFGTLWMGRFEMGPVERLWRRLTYGRPPLQQAPQAASGPHR